MKKILLIIFFSFVLTNTGLAGTFYFKQCILSETITANYIIDIESNIINATFTTADGTSEDYEDKILSIEKDKIRSELIQNKTKTNYYYQYYLDVKSQSVFRQRYLKESEEGFIMPDGPKKQARCLNIKADWDKDKIEDTKTNKEQEEIKKAQEKILNKQVSLINCQESSYKEWNNCKGSYETESGYKYSGKFKNGQIIEGTALYPGDGKYVGQFKNEEPHGVGTFLNADGSKYTGDWQNGKNHGNGTKTWKDGRKYSGEFNNDQLHGKGTFTSPKGEKYVGEFKNNKRHGEGTLTYANGKTYIGKFVAGYEHGEGTCFKSDGSSIDCTKDISSTGKNTHNISIGTKKWIKISKYNYAAGDKLRKDFDKRAAELCVSTGNFNILDKKVEIFDMDETPAIGLETVVKIGINGVVECI